MVQDDPRVLAIIETRQHVFDELYTLQLKEFETPDGSRVVTGVQREVIKSRLDRHTKMDLLHPPPAAQAQRRLSTRTWRRSCSTSVDPATAYTSRPSRSCREYTACGQVGVTNAMIEALLEEFRLVARAWIQAKQRETIAEALAQRAAAAVAPAQSQRLARLALFCGRPRPTRDARRWHRDDGRGSNRCCALFRWDCTSTDARGSRPYRRSRRRLLTTESSC